MVFGTNELALVIAFAIAFFGLTRKDETIEIVSGVLSITIVLWALGLFNIVYVARFFPAMILFFLLLAFHSDGVMRLGSVVAAIAVFCLM